MKDIKTEDKKKATVKQAMITGTPWKALAVFAVPMILSSLFQQFYNIIDSVVAGKYLAGNALTAIGTSSAIVFLYIAVAIGFSIGCSVVIAQLFGAKKFAQMKTAVYTAFVTSICIAVLLTAAGTLALDALLRLMNAPSAVYQDARNFLRLYQYGLVLVFVYNTATAVFNALGKSLMPLMFLGVSVVLNVILAYYFAVTLGFGVKGIAFSTLVCEFVSTVLAVFFLILELRKIQPEAKTKIFHRKTFHAMFKVALPSIFQQSMVSIGMLMIQRLVNEFDPVVTNGYYAALRIDGIAIMPIVSVGNAISTFVAQNIGAKKFERIPKGYKAGLFLDTILCVMLAVMVFPFAEHLIGFFLESPDSPSVKIGANYLYVVASFYIFVSIMNTTNGVFRGAGDMKHFLAITFFNLFSRIVIAYILVSFLDFHAIWWSMVASWIFSCTLALIHYKSGKWKKVKLI